MKLVFAVIAAVLGVLVLVGAGGSPIKELAVGLIAAAVATVAP